MSSGRSRQATLALHTGSNITACYREYGATALGFSSACALFKDVILGRDTRLPLVGSQSNLLPPTWAAMWIDFHVLLLLIPVTLAVQIEPQSVSKEATESQKRDYIEAQATISQGNLLFNTGTAMFFLLTSCSRTFAPTLAVFAVPTVSVAIHSILMSILQHASAGIGSLPKRRRNIAVSEVAANALLALFVFAAVMLVPPVRSPNQTAIK